MRKVIQITATGHENTSSTQSDLTLFALCNDGAMFCIDSASWKWHPVTAIPQPSSGHKCESDRICHALGGVVCEDDEE